MTDPTRALRTRLDATPYACLLGVQLEEATVERVRLRVPYADQNSNPGRALHGGVAASVIDIAGTLAAWAGVDDGDAPGGRTLDLSVDYLAAAIGEDIVAEARVLRRGKELTYTRVDVRTDAGKAIAAGLVTHRVAPAAPRERTRVEPPAPTPAAAGDVPSLARALVSLPFIARLGMAIIHMHDGQAVIGMPFRSDHTDRDGTVHEGALAALLDTTGAMASWSLVGLDLRYKASTVGIHVQYDDSARGEGVVASGQTRTRTNEIFLNTVSARGADSGRLVATASVTYRIVVPD